ncbi:3-hydroxybutyryl-CoA epimerase [Lewinellaceae bacterium SD302]|nr:3-hydroxybutyryl-CoA epimerase [Lewinellaceae bacterium SD302]
MIHYRKDTDKIVTLFLDMDGRDGNVINHEIVAAFEPLLEHLLGEKDKGELNGVIITSNKKTFLEGGDLEYLYHATDPEELYHSSLKLKRFLRDLEQPGVPVVAAINGDAIGTGFELALACHHRIVLDNPKIRVGHPEVKIGLIPSGGAIIRLMWLLGIERAFPLLLEGRRYSPQEALKVGIIDSLASNRKEMLEQAKAWLLTHPDCRRTWDDPDQGIPGGTAHDPDLGHRIRLMTAKLSSTTHDRFPAHRAIIEILAEGSKVDFETAYRLDSRYYAHLATTPVSKSMISTFWFDKQAVRKGLNRPKGYGRFRPKRVGVIGAGRMGSAIAFTALRNGLEVRLKDVSQPIADRGLAYISEKIDSYIERGTFQPEEKEELLNRVKATDRNDVFEECDLIIEAVYENKMVKQKVLREAEDHLDEYSIFATNTISIPVSQLAEQARRPENYVGIHFFVPAEKNSVVEIVKGENTSEETVARAFDFATAIRKTPLVVKDVWGFYAGRVQNTYILEGITMLQEGYPAALIENIGVQSGMPKGPLELADELGLEIVRRYERQAAEHYGSNYEPHPAASALDKMIDELNRKGRSAKGGFYNYDRSDEDHQYELWPDLHQHFSITKDGYDRRRMQERFLYTQVIEAGWCMHEGVLKSRAAANLGSVYGWGFPAHTGGVMRYVYTYGLEKFIARCAFFQERYGPRFRMPGYFKKITMEELGELSKVE